MNYHKPVLLKESIEGLKINPNGVYIDATFGGGGHSTEILNNLDRGRLIAFDRDQDAELNTIHNEKFKLLITNYKNMKKFLRVEGINKVDGIVADLGLSSHQLDISSRGFSFRFDDDLDMRMDKNMSLTAKKVLNSYTEEDLSMIFYNYGEIKQSRRLASEIISFRNQQEIRTTFDLIEILKSIISNKKSNQFFSRVFQSIRIEVNNEIDSLKIMLEDAVDLLKTRGRFTVISYHSLEDRLVKNLFKKGNISGKINKDFFGNIIDRKFKEVNKKVILPSKVEQEENNRSRSAKLRIAERI